MIETKEQYEEALQKLCQVPDDYENFEEVDELIADIVIYEGENGLLEQRVKEIKENSDKSGWEDWDDE